MQVVLSNLMAAVLFIHAVLGCCRHPSLACASCNDPTAQASRAASCCKQHRSENGQGEQRQAPCKCKVECRGVCTYLPPQKTQLDCQPALLPFDLLALNPASTAGPSALPWEVLRGSLALEPPLRLHLLHQILLI